MAWIWLEQAWPQGRCKHLVNMGLVTRVTTRRMGEGDIGTGKWSKAVLRFVDGSSMDVAETVEEIEKQVLMREGEGK